MFLVKNIGLYVGFIPICHFQHYFNIALKAAAYAPPSGLDGGNEPLQHDIAVGRGGFDAAVRVGAERQVYNIICMFQNKW